MRPAYDLTFCADRRLAWYALIASPSIGRLDTSIVGDDHYVGLMRFVEGDSQCSEDGCDKEPSSIEGGTPRRTRGLSSRQYPPLRHVASYLNADKTVSAQLDFGTWIPQCFGPQASRLSDVRG